MRGQAVLARRERHGSLIEADLRRLPALQGIANLAGAGLQVHVGGDEAVRRSLAAEGAADGARDREIGRHERLEQGERQVRDRPRGVPRAGLAPLSVGAEAGVVGILGSPAEVAQSGGGGTGGETRGTGERPGARLLILEVETLDLPAPRRGALRAAGQPQIEAAVRGAHGEGDGVAALRAAAGQHHRIEGTAGGADLGGVQVEHDRALPRQIHIGVEGESGGVVGLEYQRLPVGLGADVRRLERSREVSLHGDGAAGLGQCLAQVGSLEAEIEIGRRLGEAARGGETGRAGAQVEPRQAVALPRQLQVQPPGDRVSPQVAGEIGDVHLAVRIAIAQGAVAGGGERQPARILRTQGARIEVLPVHLQLPGHLRLPRDEPLGGEAAAEHVALHRAKRHLLLIAAAGEPPAPGWNAGAGEIGVQVQLVIGERPLDLGVTLAAHHRGLSLERIGEAAPIGHHVEVEILPGGADRALGGQVGAVRGLHVQRLDQVVRAAPGQPVVGDGRAQVRIGACNLPFGGEIVELALDPDVGVGNLCGGPRRVERLDVHSPHVGGEIQTHLPHRCQHVALRLGGERLGRTHVDPEFLQGAMEGSGDGDGRCLRRVIRGLGREVEVVGAHGLHVARGPQAESGAVHVQALDMKKIAQPVAPGVERDLVQAKGRLALMADLHVLDQGVAHHDVHRQVNGGQPAVAGVRLGGRQDDPDLLGVQALDVQLPAGKLPEVPGERHVADRDVHRVRLVMDVPQIERTGERAALGAHGQSAGDESSHPFEENPGPPLRGHRVEHEDQAENQRP